MSEALDGYLRSSDALTLAPLGDAVASPRAAAATSRPKRARLASLDPGMLRLQTKPPMEGGSASAPSGGRLSFEFDLSEPSVAGVSSGEVGEGGDSAIVDVVSWLARCARRRRLEAMGKKTLLSWAARQRYKRALAVLLAPMSKPGGGGFGNEVSDAISPVFFRGNCS